MKIAPSILAANLARMAEAARVCEEGGADAIHVDVMDGHFVPNLTFGVPVLKDLAQETDLPLDVHLMVSNPDRLLLRRFADCEHSSITAMTQGHDVEIPQHKAKDICLVWALKGECSTGCKRKHAHERCPKAVNTKIHELLDTCGVAQA